MPTGNQKIGLRPSARDRSPQSVQSGSTQGAPVTQAVRELLAAHGMGKNVQVVEGPRLETHVPENMKHMKSDVRTLEGKVV